MGCNFFLYIIICLLLLYNIIIIYKPSAEWWICTNSNSGRRTKIFISETVRLGYFILYTHLKRYKIDERQRGHGSLQSETIINPRLVLKQLFDNNYHVNDTFGTRDYYIIIILGVYIVSLTRFGGDNNTGIVRTYVFAIALYYNMKRWKVFSTVPTLY